MECEEDCSESITSDPSETIHNCPSQSAMIENTMVEAMKTVLVPVRDPITKQVQTMLVPVETRDDSGLNIIKSILMPVYGRDGSVAYDVKKVVVPIQPRLNLYHQEVPVFNTVLYKNKVNQGYCENRIEQKRLEMRVQEEAIKKREELERRDLEKRLWDEIKRVEEVRKVEAARIEETRQQAEEARKVEEVKRAKNVGPIRIAEIVGKATAESAATEGATDASNDEDFRILDAIRNVCPLCQRSFKDEGYMRRHVRLIHKKPFKCKKCHKGYFTDFALEEHQKKHEVVSFHQCSVCQMHYKTVLGLKNHKLREHSKLEPKYTCDYCGKQFKIKVNLKNHIDGVHLNPPIVCRYCGVSVKHIQSHELKHELEKDNSKEPIPQFPCALCSRKYKTWNTLENHMLLKHNDTTSNHEPGMLRTLCEKKFPSSKDFYQHVFKKPDQSNLLRCNICDRVFATEYNLRNHASVHAQSFLCSHCGKSFTHNYSLKQHMRKHTGEKPYKCKVCLKSFTSGSSLNVHAFIHTGERPYVCDVCGQKFTQRSSMMVHRRKQHGNLPPPPPLVRSKSCRMVDPFRPNRERRYLPKLDTE